MCFPIRYLFSRHGLTYQLADFTVIDTITVDHTAVYFQQAVESRGRVALVGLAGAAD